MKTYFVVLFKLTATISLALCLWPIVTGLMWLMNTPDTLMVCVSLVCLLIALGCSFAGVWLLWDRERKIVCDSIKKFQSQ